MAEATILDGRHTYRPQAIGPGLRLVLPRHVLHLHPGVLHRVRQDARQPQPDYRERRRSHHRHCDRRHAGGLAHRRQRRHGAILRTETVMRLPESESALRHDA